MASDDSPGEAVGTRQFGGAVFTPEAVARLRTAFERSRNPMLIVDDLRRWVTGNAAACELLGMAREEVPWHTMDEFTLQSDRGRLKEQWDAFLANGAAEGWYQLYVPDRGPVPVEFSATANVLPSRHLSVFIPPERAIADQAAEALTREPTWTPVGVGSRDRAQLTDREREIMTWVASGLQNAEIAEQLVLSPETVKSHVHNAMGKLGAHTRAHAVAIALVAGEITWAA